MTTEAYAGALSAIRKYMDDFVNMDVAKARTITATSTAGQISDISEGMRLTAGSGSIVRAQEQILDRVEFLMTEVGKTSYIRGRALNVLNLKNRMTTLGTSAFDKAEASRLKALIDDETSKTLRGIEIEKQKSGEFVDNLREIHKSNPEMLGPLMLAWELSDGKIKTLSAMNKLRLASLLHIYLLKNHFVTLLVPCGTETHNPFDELGINTVPNWILQVELWTTP